MAGKTFTCGICGNEVSKRKSIIFKDKGRVCRTHQEVLDYQEEVEKERIIKIKADEAMKQASNVLNQITIVAGIRAGAFQLGIDAM